MNLKASFTIVACGSVLNSRFLISICLAIYIPSCGGKDANIGLAPPQASTELGARSGIVACGCVS
jgi:hypothetical protein